MKTANIILSAALLAGTCFPVLADQELHLEWVEKDGKQYWYENGEIQGKEGDDKNITDEIYGIERGREIYDPASDAWYWLDANNGGAKAVNKDVWMPYVYQDETPGSTEGKWVRYDEEGKMIKGWYIDGQKVYYFDLVTGAMAKGYTTIDNYRYWFKPVSGLLAYTDLSTVRNYEYDVYSAALLLDEETGMRCEYMGIFRNYHYVGNQDFGYTIHFCSGTNPFEALEVSDNFVNWEDPPERVILTTGKWDAIVYRLERAFKSRIENCYYLDGGIEDHLYIYTQTDDFDDLRNFPVFALDYVKAE